MATVDLGAKMNMNRSRPVPNGPEVQRSNNSVNEIRINKFSDIPIEYRQDFILKAMLGRAFIKARNALWNNLSKNSATGRVKYI